MCCFFVLSDDNFSERAWPETCFESGTSVSLDDAVKQHREFILDAIFCFLLPDVIWGHYGRVWVPGFKNPSTSLSIFLKHLHITFLSGKMLYCRVKICT